MKRFGKVLLIIAVVIILLAVITAGAVMIFKPELVRVVYDGLMLDSEQIEEKKKENDKQLVNTINDFGLNMTEEDMEKLGSGELSEEEIKDILLGNKKDTTPEKIPEDEEPDSVVQDKPNEPVTQSKPEIKPGDEPESKPEIEPDDKPCDKPEKKPGITEKPDVNKPPVKEETPEKVPGKPAQEKVPEHKEEPVNDKTENKDDKAQEYEEKIAELIARMYALKSQFIGKINGIVASMKKEYVALPKEQRTMASKTSIANRYLGQITALEAQCDAQVNLVVTELRDVLSKSGRDTSLADAVMTAYNNEKETTKAAYINKYSN